jgi:pimeloyl-ACP methyl ester carboxylesterase
VTEGQATIVLVHGAWHGAWCWDAVVERLTAAGVACVAVELPSVNGSTDLAADGDHVRRVLDEIDGPVVLVGHSYGGAVITDAGDHDTVRELVYLTAFVLDDGESLIDNALEGGEDMTLPASLRFVDDGTVHFDTAAATETFFHDCAPEVAANAVSKLRPMSVAAMSGAPRSIAWRAKPAQYIVCTDDRALPVKLQESSARRLGVWTELDASHSPFLSQPDQLAAHLVELSR